MISQETEIRFCRQTSTEEQNQEFKARRARPVVSKWKVYNSQEIYDFFLRQENICVCVCICVYIHIYIFFFLNIAEAWSLKAVHSPSLAVMW